MLDFFFLVLSPYFFIFLIKKLWSVNFSMLLFPFLLSFPTFSLHKDDLDDRFVSLWFELHFYCFTFSSMQCASHLANLSLCFNQEALISQNRLSALFLAEGNWIYISFVEFVFEKLDLVSLSDMSDLDRKIKLVYDSMIAIIAFCIMSLF